MRILHFSIAGALAGAISAYSFALIHGFFISDIWFSLPVLLVAGAICGLCLGWTYGLLFEAPSLHTWLQYNALYVGMFVLLGCVSVLVYEPVTTLAAVMASNSPPGYLFKQALPVTIVSTILMAAIIGRLYARSLAQNAAVLLTCAVLVLLLGLNVSVIGLISIPRSSTYLIGELAGLILALNVVFAVVFVALEWKTFFGDAKHLLLLVGKRGRQG
jgi:hypothetical protein